MKFSHLIVLSVQNTVVNGGALSIKNCFPSFSSSSAINAQTLSGTGRGGRLLITIILIILLFFLSVCRAHVVRVATKTKSEGRFYFFRFFSFSWPLTRRKRWKFGPRLSSWKTRRKKERHSTAEVRRRTWIENEGTPRFFAIFFVLLARMRWKSTSRTGRYRRLERVRFASVDTNGRFSLFSRVIFFDPFNTRRGWMCIGNVRVLGECENMRRGLER